jgi:hypothetical protein
MLMSSITGRVIAKGRLGGGRAAAKDIDGIIGKAQKVYVKELVFSTHYEFPAIGDCDKLYIATDENAQYRYDELDHAYHCVGRDPEDIEAIQIRLKEDT